MSRTIKQYTNLSLWDIVSANDHSGMMHQLVSKFLLIDEGKVYDAELVGYDRKRFGEMIGKVMVKLTEDGYPYYDNGKQVGIEGETLKNMLGTIIHDDVKRIAQKWNNDKGINEEDVKHILWEWIDRQNF